MSSSKCGLCSMHVRCILLVMNIYLSGIVCVLQCAGLRCCDRASGACL
jgi:hypothetical protein